MMEEEDLLSVLEVDTLDLNDEENLDCLNFLLSDSCYWILANVTALFTVSGTWD